MSLSKLSPRLIAEIGSFLEFKEVRNLMEVNKRMARTMKMYRLDKPKCWKLFLQYRVDNPTVSVLIAFAESDREYTRIVDYQQDDEKLYEKYVEMVEKFISMDSLIFHNIHMTEDLANKVMNLSTKISLFWMEHAEMKINKHLFIKLCQRFGRLRFQNVTFDLDEIATDEVFCQIVKSTIIEITWPEFLTNYHFMGRQIIQQVPLTDAVLKEWGNSLPNRIFLEHWETNFTMNGIKKLFEEGLKKNFEENVFWNFGLMKHTENEAVDEFIHDLDQGIYGHFETNLPSWDTWVINRHDNADKFIMVFSVYNDLHEGEINGNPDDDSDNSIDRDLSDIEDMFNLEAENVDEDF